MPMLNVVIPLDGSAFSRAVLSHVKTTLFAEHHILNLLQVATLPEEMVESECYPSSLDGWATLQRWGEELIRPTDDRSMARAGYHLAVQKELKAELIDHLGNAKELLESWGFHVNVSVRFGDPCQEIVEFVESEGMDLIMMATHGRSSLGRVFLGSVAEAVLRKVNIPVVMLRPIMELAEEALPLKSLINTPVPGG
ncbi:MAG: universal stress protein [Trueperaceae bacterium]|nr:MAG: universal stress protein [Trueperaceae bacterium]